MAKSLEIGVSKHLVFAAGSMFWARNEILHTLRNLSIEEHEYTTNHNQLDGAIPHAVERLFGVVAIHHEKKSWLF